MGLSEEQDGIRLRGLRILARMIARAHMAYLREEAGGRNEDCPGGPVSLDREVRRKDGDHVR